MIINVKSTQSETAASANTHPYQFGEEPKNSRWPYAFAAVLMGIALYIKSMFPGSGEAEAEARAPEQPEEDGGEQSGPRYALDQTGQSAQQDASAAAGADQKQEEAAATRAVGSGGQVIDLLRRASFESILSPELPVMDYGPYTVSAGPFSFDGAVMIANDNTPPEGSDPGVGGPGIGGPGNNQPDPPDNDPEDEDEEEQINRAPRVKGPVYLADVGGCAIALIGLSDLLVNAVDPDGDTLSVRNITVSSGSLTATQGGWHFDAAGYGPVTITYQITDGALSVTQTAHLNVVRNSIAGTSGNDVLVGTECGDDIDGGEGHDNIDARGGGDTVIGGGGNDHIVAGGGADIVFAGLGNDIVFGGDGDDWISGGAGNDRLFGQAGDDTLFGDEGEDQISGGDGKDLLFGGADKDRLSGDGGNDRLFGGDSDDELDGGAGDDVAMGEAGADLLKGGAGNDTMSGGEGEDEVYAGAGHDTVIGDLDSADDSYDGGSGTDTLSYAAASQSIVVDLEEETAEGEEIGTDEVRSFEAVETGAGDDEISGSDADEVLSGNQGNDSVAGEGGDDVVAGGEGCDTLSGGEGEDHVDAGAGNDVVTGDLDMAADHYDGGAGIDTIDYSAATTSVSFDLHAGRISGVEVGEDTISNFEVFVGGKGNDHFRGNGHGGSFHGGNGDDIFEFEALSGAGQRVAYEILDFMAGDRIKVSRYEIFEEVMDSLEDRFEDVYGDDIDDDDMPIQISHEYTGNVRRTLIEADLDNDQHYELAITISGDNQVTISETA